LSTPRISQGNSQPPPQAAWEVFRQIPFNKILSAWDEIDEKGENTECVRQLCLNDRYYLLIKLLHRYDAWHPWLYERCREVEQAPDGYIDIWAREHYKSTIITFAGCIQEILRNSEITIGVFSHTKPIAKGFLAQIQRELESNETLKALFPDTLWDDPASQAPSWSLDGGLIINRSSNPKEATIEAHGLVDGQPTSKHFQVMVYDDVVTRESVSTPDQILKTTEAWELSDNLGVAGGRRWIIGTRYHYADTYAEIIKRGAATPRIYPATDDGTLTGRPVLFTQSEWGRRVRDQGEATVACQLLANPLAGKQRVFDIKDLQEYEIRPSFLNVYILIDPGRSVKKDSADTAMMVLGLSTTGNIYLLDGMAHKMALEERWKNMAALRWKWGREPGVQSIHVGYEKYGADADLDFFKLQMQKPDEDFFPIERLPPEGTGHLGSEKSKPDRIQRLTPDVKGHRFLVPYPTDENNLTKLQREALKSGRPYLIAEPIRRQDEHGKVYDLTEKFRMQMSLFPFGGLVDILDATARIYDIDPQVPEYVTQESLEPEVVY
jgi:hypothetical protein